jgi:hypothetical protein
LIATQLTGVRFLMGSLVIPALVQFPSVELVSAGMQVWHHRRITKDPEQVPPAVVAQTFTMVLPKLLPANRSAKAIPHWSTP